MGQMDQLYLQLSKDAQSLVSVKKQISAFLRAFNERPIPGLGRANDLLTFAVNMSQYVISDLCDHNEIDDKDLRHSPRKYPTVRLSRTNFDEESPEYGRFICLEMVIKSGEVVSWYKPCIARDID